MDGLSVQTTATDENYVYLNLSILLQDEGLYNRLRQKRGTVSFVLSEGQIIQPPTERSISVLHTCNRHLCPL
jgi:hypothetical protein